jgi:hypothetical protein
MKDEEDIEKRQDRKNSGPNGNQNFDINKIFIENGNEINNDREIINVPVLQTLHINLIQIRPVNFDNNQVKIISRKRELIPDLPIQNSRNINFKNYSLNDKILAYKFVNTVKIPFIDIMSPIEIEQREFTPNDLIVNLKNEIFKPSIPNLSTIDMKNISLCDGFSFNHNVDNEAKREMQNISNLSPGNISFNDELKLPWGNKEGPIGLPDNVSDKFFIIAVKTEYSEIVAINYRDFFRVNYGGTPEIERIENIEELEQKLEQTGEHKLIIVKNSTTTNETKNHLHKLVDNAPYQLQGCIILSADNVETFREYNLGIKIIEDDVFEGIQNYGDKLLNVISGFQTESLGSLTLSNFQENFKDSIIGFDDKISEYSKLNFLKENLPENLYKYIVKNRDILVNTNSESEKNATSIHAGMKGFIFVFKRKVKIDEITLEDKKEHSSDVYVRSDTLEEYYEAETFFGRGDTIALLSSKIKKYKYCSGKLIFLLRNIDIIRYFHSLKELLIAYKDDQNFPEVEICGFNFEDNNLKSIKEISQYLN